MADVRGSAVDCNDKCGCPTPCPGGVDCRCGNTAGGDTDMEHKRCSCGEHCSCNPCTCTKTDVVGTGKAFCKCGAGCDCSTCAD